MSKRLKYSLIGAGILAVFLWCSVLAMGGDDHFSDPRYYSPRG